MEERFNMIEARRIEILHFFRDIFIGALCIAAYCSQDSEIAAMPVFLLDF